MDPHIYDELVKQEKSHWWFFSRRAIAYTLLRGISTLPPRPLILEAGCGSGGNLPMLSSIGDVFAMEPHEGMLARAKARKTGQVEPGSLPGHIPFDVNFDLVALFDVLEHVQDDRAALDALYERMNPGAVMCLTVPAHPWLFSRLDREHHHYRRYRKRQIRKLVQESGMYIQYMSYWNCLLLPVAALVRLLENFDSKRNYSIGTRMPPRWLNAILKKLVGGERHITPHLPLPFGLSLVIIARKPVY